MKLQTENIHLLAIDFRGRNDGAVAARSQFQCDCNVRMNVAERAEGGEDDALAGHQCFRIEMCLISRFVETQVDLTTVTSPALIVLTSPSSVSTRNDPSLSSPRVVPSRLPSTFTHMRLLLA